MKVTITSKHPQTLPSRTQTLKVELMSSVDPIEGSCELWINGNAYILSAIMEEDLESSTGRSRRFYLTKNPDKTRTVFSR